MADERARQTRSWMETLGGVALFIGIGLVGNGLAFYCLHAGSARGPLIVVAVGLVVVAAALAAMYRRLVWMCRSPSLPLSLIVLAAALLGAAAFGLLSALNARHFRRVHLADRGSGRLDPRTIKILRGLDEPLRIVGTLVPMRSPLEQFNNHIRERANTMLAEYAKQSPQVSFIAFDVSRDPDARERLRKELRLKGELLRDSVVFARGGETRSVEFSQLLAMPTATGKLPTFRGEAVFTGALQALLEGTKTRVYFVKGHGEKLTDDFGEAGAGLSAIASLLRGDNCTVRTIELPEIPDDCHVLVIPGPRTLLPLHEIQAVRQYAKKPGRGLIVLLDPVSKEDPRGSGIEDVLAEYGIVAETQQTILNVVRTLLGRHVSGTVATTQYPARTAGQGQPPRWHPITEDLRQFRTVFEIACPMYVHTRPVAPLQPELQERDPFNYEIIRTPSRAFARRRVRPEDIKGIQPQRNGERRGPFGLAVARGTWRGGPTQGQAPPGRLVAFGDSDFITNAFIQRGTTGNAMLFRNVVAWAAGKEYKVGIPPKPFHAIPRLDLSPEDRAFACWATVVAPPFHVVLLGFFVWWMRRR